MLQAQLNPAPEVRKIRFKCSATNVSLMESPRVAQQESRVLTRPLTDADSELRAITSYCPGGRVHFQTSWTRLVAQHLKPSDPVHTANLPRLPRCEYHIENFLGFVHIACIHMMIRSLWYHF